MKRTNKDWQDIKLKPGDMLVVYRGTSKVFPMDENSVVVKGNIKRDKIVETIFKLVEDRY